MGKLIIISGPSGVGKGPLVKTLEIYLKAVNKTLVKHVLYNARDKRAGEVQGETYWYSYLWDKEKCNWNWRTKSQYDKEIAEDKLEHIRQVAINNGEDFEKFNLVADGSGDWQGLNYTVLEEELRDNDIVLLEIIQKEVDNVVKFCEDGKKGHKTKRIFVSPLYDDDYKDLGCSTQAERAIATEATMLVKLRGRARENEVDIRKRAKRAIKEVEEARILRDKGEIHYFVNHFGEDMKTAWESLQERVEKFPEIYTDPKFSNMNGIDKTFKEFLELINI